MAKKKDIKKMAIVDLNKSLNDLKESLFNYRFQKSLQQLEHPQKISQVKKEIARVKTLIRQLELQKIGSK